MDKEGKTEDKGRVAHYHHHHHRWTSTLTAYKEGESPHNRHATGAGHFQKPNWNKSLSTQTQYERDETTMCWRHRSTYTILLMFFYALCGYGFVNDQKVCLFCVTFWSNNSVVRDIGVILGHKVALVTSDILV